jgi:indolepyruvate ferredoxin oxidoreductase alpha subunit
MPLAKKIITGNEAVALGALRAGLKVVTGYPGTPSTGALACLLDMDLACTRPVPEAQRPVPEAKRRVSAAEGGSTHVEWSTNEKVALEVATGASWAGQRALCTMKMSGLNVAYDSLISIAYSGCIGGLVIYVADDPGTNAGMCEQDSRGFALMSDLPMLEPASVAEAYRLTQAAFELSEQIEAPVFLRLVTGIANSVAAVEVEEPPVPEAQRKARVEARPTKDIARFTKAGAAICLAQHRDLIARLEKAGQIIREMQLNQLQLAVRAGGLGIVAAGVTASYLDEGFEIAAQFGFERDTASVLRVVAVNPFPATEVQALLRHCRTILVLEELEPYIEKGVCVEAQKLGFDGRIVGKLGGLFSRIGEYDVSQVVRGIGTALGLPIPGDLFEGNKAAEQLAASRPITFCAGCPHRGTFMAINQAIKKLRYKKDTVVVTGDIGCTILGMNPPFLTVWNEISMGASVSLAQGYVHGGVKTPVIATIGDSTFFHGGIPGLINAVQYQVPLTLIILDNGWTSMTGMQVNPGTDEAFQQPGNRRVDIARIIPALGVENFFIINPYDLAGSSATIQKALTLPGVKVVLSQQECTMPAMRRGIRVGEVRVIPENCNLCKLCIAVSGCPAIDIAADAIVIDPALCSGCGLCAEVCIREAIVKEPVV